jgi:hypothetical protein
MPLLRKDQLQNIVTDENTMGTTLLIVCVDAFGLSFFEWEPETFDLDCKYAFDTELPQINKDKVWSLVTALTTNLFYISLETFMPICNVLNGSKADFSTYDPVDSDEAAWGIVEVMINDPPEEGEDVSTRFSHEIKRYVGLTLKAEGITTPPRILLPFVEYDRDPEEEAGIEIGPDEHMLKMHEDRQRRERESIERYINQQLVRLGAQIQQLPLQQGDTSRIGAYLQQIQRAVTSSQPAAESEPLLSVL